MSTYAIGDLQGCYQPLEDLLNHLNFDASQDALWFTGDLVNRGPDSLKTLRYVKQLGERAITILGNHDLHLLAVAEGVKQAKNADSLAHVLQADDCDELLHWLRHRPVLYDDKELGYTMIHAGLPPQWTADQTHQYARELESVLQGADYKKFFKHMYGNSPNKWSPKLKHYDRLRFITNCFTRLRFCKKDGALCLQAKGPLGSQPANCQPWFEHPERKSQSMNLVFGHWSALGIYQSKGINALDSGCVWGNRLTAMRLEDKKLFSVQCPEYHEIE